MRRLRQDRRGSRLESNPPQRTVASNRRHSTVSSSVKKSSSPSSLAETRIVLHPDDEERHARRGARLGMVTSPLAFILGLGFALPFLLVGVPIRLGLTWAGRGQDERSRGPARVRPDRRRGIAEGSVAAIRAIATRDRSSALSTMSFADGGSPREARRQTIEWQSPAPLALGDFHLFVDLDPGLADHSSLMHRLLQLRIGRERLESV